MGAGAGVGVGRCVWVWTLWVVICGGLGEDTVRVNVLGMFVAREGVCA